MQTKIKAIEFEKECRILVTSDIHANLSRFKRLLIKMNYRQGIDYLIVNGDIIEKGPENLELVRFIKHLTEVTNRVLVTMGNCDELASAILAEEDFYNYSKAKKNSFVQECFRKLSIDIGERYFSPREIKDILLSTFEEEIRWLDSLPLALVSHDHIFVHAGVPAKTKKLTVTDAKVMLSLRGFYQKGHILPQMVVVGHYPVRNYHIRDSFDNSVIIDRQRRIIALDGGNGIESDGQLNGLIITKNDRQYQYQTVAVDEFNYYEITRDYQPEMQRNYNIVWPYRTIEFVDWGADFSWCKVLDVIDVNKVMLKNEYINTNGGKQSLLKYHSATKLAVKKGEKVKLVDDACSGFDYIKKDGVLGWIPKRIMK